MKNEPVALNNKETGDFNISGDSKPDEFAGKIAKSGIDKETLAIMEKEMAEKKRFGFLAQDVEKIFPDLVYTTVNGSKAINYVEMIAILVESIKEQQTKIEELCAEIENLKSVSSFDEPFHSTSNMTGATGITNPLIAQCKLHQNAPNPFKERTEIQYYLPKEVKSAEIYIFNLQGSLLRKIPAPHSGSVEIRGSNLSAGMYIYTLVADGQTVDTKRMILTK